MEVEVSRTRPVITPDATYNVGSFRHQGIVSVRVRVSVSANQDIDTVGTGTWPWAEPVGRGTWGVGVVVFPGPLTGWLRTLLRSVLPYGNH